MLSPHYYMYVVYAIPHVFNHKIYYQSEWDWYRNFVKVRQSY